MHITVGQTCVSALWYVCPNEMGAHTGAPLQNTTYLQRGGYKPTRAEQKNTTTGKPPQHIKTELQLFPKKCEVCPNNTLKTIRKGAETF
ncbi:MAG: hypothetical protein LBE91_04465 [Tannerella sp.]|nr:hypothetical protein [Tannerella sp.]